jgi:hypothetical protein
VESSLTYRVRLKFRRWRAIRRLPATPPVRTVCSLPLKLTSSRLLASNLTWGSPDVRVAHASPREEMFGLPSTRLGMPRLWGVDGRGPFNRSQNGPHNVEQLWKAMEDDRQCIRRSCGLHDYRPLIRKLALAESRL